MRAAHSSRYRFLLTPLREGRPVHGKVNSLALQFLLTPLREGRPSTRRALPPVGCNFYSRPCGRGDCWLPGTCCAAVLFLLTPLREGRRTASPPSGGYCVNFYSRPCGRGDVNAQLQAQSGNHFYSRPCGRGDALPAMFQAQVEDISTHAPAGGATRRNPGCRSDRHNFYSRPCGRGDRSAFGSTLWRGKFLLTPLREGRRDAFS